MGQEPSVAPSQVFRCRPDCLNLIATSTRFHTASRLTTIVFSQHCCHPQILAYVDIDIHMQDARIAIAMGYTSKYKRELDAEREYHIATRKRLGQALQVTQYLQAKIETLRGVVAGLSMGSELEIPLPCFSEDLEVMERT